MKNHDSYEPSRVDELLMEGFEVEELLRFCSYTPEFRGLRDRLPEEQGKKPEIVRKIVEFAVRKRLVDVILNWAQKKNPKLFEELGPYKHGYSVQQFTTELDRTHQQQTGTEEGGEFDVFLAHNSEDKPQVEIIGGALKRRGLNPWLDKWDLPPGRMFQEEIETVLPLIKSMAVFVGPSGIGPWEQVEIRMAMSQFVKRKSPVIPVLLPGVESEPELPLVLQEFNWVRFSAETDDEALDALMWGITGRKP